MILTYPIYPSLYRIYIHIYIPQETIDKKKKGIQELIIFDKLQLHVLVDFRAVFQ